MTDRADTLFAARIDDAVRKAEKGTLAVLSFLTPRERRMAERQLCAAGQAESAFFFGGYATAERVALFLLPDYLTVCLSAPLPQCSPEEVLTLLGEDASDAVSAVRIVGSGFRTLSHRDFLGAVLGLGLQRESLGDLALQNEREAVLFCSRPLVPFLTEHLCKVGSDTVRCVPYVPDASFTDGRRYLPIRDTVASARLDCVVAALCNFSREEAQRVICSGLVELDFEPVERTDLVLVPPAVISVRGAGRFYLRSFDGETKKARLRLSADKMI